jgi:type IV pilus assembly protein PilY1
VASLQGIPTLYFGPGDRSHPLNPAVTDRMFAVRDRGQLTADAIDIANLKNLTDNVLQAASTTTAQADAILADLTTTDNTVAGHYGWYVDLDQSAGEKVLAPSLVFNKQAFYTTYMPSADEDLDVCQIGNLGESRLYQLDYATAEATFDYSSANNSASTYATNIRAKGGDGIGLQREDRVRTIGVGIPSGIVTLIDASGKVTLMISSSNRVGTYQAPSAKMMSPLYWIQY